MLVQNKCLALCKGYHIKDRNNLDLMIRRYMLYLRRDRLFCVISAFIVFKKSDDQTNIDKNRVATNITEYHIISKLIFLRIIITKFICIRNHQYHTKFEIDRTMFTKKICNVILVDHHDHHFDK